VKQSAQLERTAAELASANQRLELLDRLKAKFYANMNHELRTPLNSIIGFAEDALDGLAGPLSEELAQYFTTIFRSGTRQLALITDVLDLAKLQAGRATLDLEAVGLAELVSEIRDALKPLFARKQQTFVVDIPEGALLEADHQKAYQVLLNLVSNAHKYGPTGGTISVKAAREGRWWRLSVHDNGPGVPPEELPRIFEEFHQVDRKHSPRQQGTGLGLAITRQLVELHGGVIRAESEPGRGATFTFTLPAAEEAAS
jgi:signal transduction histidine kinase